MTATARAGVALLAVTMWADAARAVRPKGPLVTHVTGRSAFILWETAEPSMGRVELTAADGSTRTVQTPGPARHHRAALVGLTPGAEWRYQARSGETAFGDPGRFRTAPEGGAFRFVVYGDHRSDRTAHARVATSAAAEPGVDFAIDTGDMVGHGGRDADWAGFFAAERPHLRDRAMFGVIGNHEVAGGSAAGFLRWFGSAEGRAWYAFRWAASLFVVLDGWHDGDPDALDARQLAWARATLGEAARDPGVEHVFVVTHAGPFSSRRGRTGSAGVRALLDDIAAAKGRLVFSGHDHCYEHGVATNGLHYVIAGGGGAPLYTTRPRDTAERRVLESATAHHYLVVDVDGPRIRVLAREPSGRMLDVFEIDAKTGKRR